jgi:membrane protein
MIKQFVKELYLIWISERPNQLAAALAYYSMFSFAPIIFLIVSITGLFIKEINLADQFFQRLESLFGEGISALVREAVSALSNTPSSSSILVSLISFLVLLYAASGLFYQLQFSLNTIWRVPPPQKGQTTSFIRQRLFSFLIVIGVGLLGVFVTLASFLLAWFGSLLERLVGIGGSQVFAAKIGAPILIFLIIALFYKVLPETRVAWKDVWLGAIISTTLILAAVILVGFFFQYISLNSALQATGAFTVLLVGFYYIAQIFLLGVVCCRVYAGNYGSKRSIPDLGPG